MSQEKPNKEELLTMEDDLLRGLLDAAGHQGSETVTIEIARDGRAFFRFKVRGLSEREYQECRDKATKYKKNRQLGGIKMPEDTDTAKYRSLLIYTATVEEDKKTLWNNKKAWEQLNVINGHDLIDKVLRAGEKDAVVAKIDELSGYNDDLEDVAKN